MHKPYLKRISPFPYGDFYRRGLDGTLIRCLEKEESNQALVDIHEGIYGGDSNGLSMA